MMGIYSKKRWTQWLRFGFTLASILTSISTLAAGDISPPNPEDGAKSWAENCSRCHNLRSPSDLRDDQWITSVFHMRVRAGLTGEETRNIIAFLQESNSKAVTGEQKPVTSTGRLSGEEIYKGTCAACHGMDGKGALPGVPDFTALSGPLSKPDSELLMNIIKGVQNGNGNLPMPPHGGNHQLTDKDMEVVLIYIRNQFATSLQNEQ